jgi:hypothetical protein
MTGRAENEREKAYDHKSRGGEQRIREKVYEHTSRGGE